MKNKSKWSGGVLGLANFEWKIIENPPTLKIRYSMPVGNGINTNVNSVLARPFRKILRDAKFPGKISYVFMRDKKRYHVLGAFSYTKKYLIFFPGLQDRRLISVGEKNYLHNGVNLNMDHITLENNFQKWHFTLEEKKFSGEKLPIEKTKQIDEKNWLWFVLKLKNIDKLESLPKEFRITLYESLEEINRRLSIIEKSRENSMFQITELNVDEKQSFFWYVEFFVSKSDKRIDAPKNPVVVMPNNSTILKDDRNESMSRIHQIFLEGFTGSIFIRVSKVRGHIDSHVIIESGASITPSKNSTDKMD